MIRFNFNILEKLEQGLDQGITDVVPQKIERRRVPQKIESPEPTLIQPDSFISTEGLTYTPLPVANQFIINTLFA